MKQGYQPSNYLKKILVAHVRTVIGPIATPDKMHFTQGLPKTRSGKIMRRILRRSPMEISRASVNTSTLADQTVVDSLIKGRQ